MNIQNTSQPSLISGWRKPLVLLVLMVIAMRFSHETWFALLNNFAIHKAGFSGKEMGMLQSIREIPGFLAFGVVYILLFVREQRLALISLVILGVGVGMTGYFPETYVFFATTMIMSIGFHYYETVAQSLALQWFDKGNAAHNLGRVIAAGSFASIGAFVLVHFCFGTLKMPYEHVYLLAGGITIAIVAFCAFAFPSFPEKVQQNKKLVLRQQYWLYYALTFFGGARRQIFIVFAGFMMVEKFGYSVTDMAALLLANHILNMFLAPQIGRMIGWIGERRALTIEYVGLIVVFTSYAFVTDHKIATALYIVDHIFFAMAIAMKTYFQKIADPADIAPTAGVAFSINHVAAVFLPVILGFIWLQSPSAVFLIGAAIAVGSLILSRFIPLNPERGVEFIWKEKQSA